MHVKNFKAAQLGYFVLKATTINDRRWVSCHHNLTVTRRDLLCAKLLKVPRANDGEPTNQSGRLCDERTHCPKLSPLALPKLTASITCCLAPRLPPSLHRSFVRSLARSFVFLCLDGQVFIALRTWGHTASLHSHLPSLPPSKRLHWARLRNKNLALQKAVTLPRMLSLRHA